MADRIKGLRALLAKATQGKWTVRGPASENDCNLHIHAASGLWVANARPWSLTKNAAKEQQANADIIVDAVNALPLLLDVAEVAREAMVDLHEVLDFLVQLDIDDEDDEPEVRDAGYVALKNLRTTLAALEGEP